MSDRTEGVGPAGAKVIGINASWVRPSGSVQNGRIDIGSEIPGDLERKVVDEIIFVRTAANFFIGEKSNRPTHLASRACRNFRVSTKISSPPSGPPR
jgi:S1-C subfamily serine protease